MILFVNPIIWMWIYSDVTNFQVKIFFCYRNKKSAIKKLLFLRLPWLYEYSSCWDCSTRYCSTRSVRSVDKQLRQLMYKIFKDNGPGIFFSFFSSSIFYVPREKLRADVFGRPVLQGCHWQQIESYIQEVWSYFYAVSPKK